MDQQELASLPVPLTGYGRENGGTGRSGRSFQHYAEQPCFAQPRLGDCTRTPRPPAGEGQGWGVLFRRL